MTIMVAPNTSTSPRSGTLTISGRTVTVDQAGTCDITISPTSVVVRLRCSHGLGCRHHRRLMLVVRDVVRLVADGHAAVRAAWATGRCSTRPRPTRRTDREPPRSRLAVACSRSRRRPPPAPRQLSTTSVSLTSAVAFRTVQVTTGSTCPWTATSSVPWVTITSGASGTGLGSVSYSVAANTGSASRTGTLTISGEPVTVTQAGVACTVDLTPTSITLGAAAADSSVAVASTGRMPVVGVEQRPAGSRSRQAARATATAAFGTPSRRIRQRLTRVGTLTIGPRGFTVTQTGGSACTASLSSNGVSLGAAGTTVQVMVSASGDCPWTASSAVTWITVTAGSTGTGPGTVTLSVAPYTGASVRTGVVTIAGKSFTVNQSGACDYSVSPTAVTVSGGASVASVWVTTGSGCAWTASSPVSWVTLSSSSGSGTGLVNLTIAANTTSAPRSATLTIGGSAVVVNQSGAACNYSVTPVSLNVTGGNHSVTVTTPAGCAWTATSNVSWMTITGSPSGSGTGTFVIHLDPNETPWTRFGFVNIAGWRIFVQQRIDDTRRRRRRECGSFSRNRSRVALARTLDDVEERLELDGLLQAGRLQSLEPFAVLGYCRHADDGHVSQRRLAELLGPELPPVHDRHHQVQQYQARAAGPHAFERLATVGRGHRLEPVRGQQDVHELPHVGIVFDDQARTASAVHHGGKYIPRCDLNCQRRAPMQKMWLSVLMKSWPCAIAGDATARSPSGFRCTT